MPITGQSTLDTSYPGGRQLLSEKPITVEVIRDALAHNRVVGFDVIDALRFMLKKYDSVLVKYTDESY